MLLDKFKLKRLKKYTKTFSIRCACLELFGFVLYVLYEVIDLFLCSWQQI